MPFGLWISRFKPVVLRVAELPPLAGLFNLSIIAKFADDTGSRAVADARHQASVPRADEKIIALGLGAMLADSEQNLFGRHRGARKIFVPRPANPLFSGGFEPAFAPRAFNAVAEFTSVFFRRTTQPDALLLVFTHP